MMMVLGNSTDILFNNLSPKNIPLASLNQKPRRNDIKIIGYKKVDIFLLMTNNF